MSNWAIVIGIDNYPASASWALNGAVHDALGMRSWLLDPRGGNVPPANLKLLLGPQAPLADPAIAYGVPTFGGIVQAIEAVLDAPVTATDRFYFHFSGHGLSARLDFATKQAIVASDFSQILPTNSLTVLSLFEVLQATTFGEQYFFVDACRNMPFDEVRLGEYPRPRRPVAPATPQFVMYATQPGVKALEVGRPGDETGAFTAALLDGLRGQGTAKAWDQDNQEYVVRWNRLFVMVEKTVRGRKLRADSAPGGPLIQLPRKFGEQGSDDPELGRFEAAAFGNEELSIGLAPAPHVCTLARLRINEMAGRAADLSPPHHLPVSITLPPRVYSILAAADGYRSKKASITVELYESTNVVVEFEALGGLPPPGPVPVAAPTRGPVPGLAPSPTPGPVPGLAPSPLLAPVPAAAAVRVPAPAATAPAGDSSAPFGLPQSRAPEAGGMSAGARSLSNERRSGVLRVASTDRLTLIRVTHESGKVIAEGRGFLSVEGLGQGYFGIALFSPEGEVIGWTIEQPRAASDSPIQLAASVGTTERVAELARFASFPVSGSGVVSPSELVGPSDSLKLSTLLALAAGARLETYLPYGKRLQSVPIVPFTRAGEATPSSGLYLILGDEKNDEYWGRVVAYVESEGQPTLAVTLTPGPKPWTTTFSSAALPLAPANYTLLLRWPESTVAIAMPFTVLAGRATIVCATREPDGSLDAHQYMMPTSAQSPNGPASTRDPDFGGGNFPAIRRIEYMQRAFAKGRLTPLDPDVDYLLQSKWRDPMAGCLGAYIAVRKGRVGELGVVTENLVTYFGGIPDAHVLRGCFLESRGDADGARSSYARSLESGQVPLFRDGLLLLSGAAHIEPAMRHRLDELLDQTLSGGAWSVVVSSASASAAARSAYAMV